jgi:hypothetical protein
MEAVVGFRPPVPRIGTVLRERPEDISNQWSSLVIRPASAVLDRVRQELQASLRDFIVLALPCCGITTVALPIPF